MAYGNSITRGINMHAARYDISFWDRLFGRAHWKELVNIRNAYIEDQARNTNEELEILRQGVIDLQPEVHLAEMNKHLNEIGTLKERIKSLEKQLETSQGNALILRREAEQSKRLLENERKPKTTWQPEPMLSKPERAQSLGRGRSYTDTNNGAHSVSGQVAGHTPDSGSLLLQTAVVAMALTSGDSDRTSGDMGRSSEVCAPAPAYSEPARSEPAYSAPAQQDSTPSYSDSSPGVSCD